MNDDKGQIDSDLALKVIWIMTDELTQKNHGG